MTEGEARTQRDNCQHCHKTNMNAATFMLPYCTYCLQAKGILGDKWFEHAGGE